MTQEMEIPKAICNRFRMIGMEIEENVLRKHLQCLEPLIGEKWTQCSLRLPVGTVPILITSGRGDHPGPSGYHPAPEKCHYFGRYLYFPHQYTSSPTTSVLAGTGNTRGSVKQLRYVTCRQVEGANIRQQRAWW